MKPIPRTALILGLAGLLPFVWGVVTLFSDPLASLTMNTVGPRFTGPYIDVQYGTIILAFMSGVLWGFASRATDEATAANGYVLSVIPALWAFFFVGGGPVHAAAYLAAGFVGLLTIDWQFWKLGLAPDWWMRLRIGLTAVVVLCLAIVILR